ncbi:MAG: radical SAM protein [Planctomycetes bacterium]|nr:radical SAM protein [Planctomycetota bacterium]
MPLSLSILPGPRLIKSTRSRCPVCLADIAAEVLESPVGVVMRKACPQHGAFEVPIAANPRYYHDSRGSSSCCGGSDCCSPAPESTNIFDRLSTCIALIEIVDSCNLTCPTCFASSPYGVGENIVCTPFDDVVRRVQGIIDRKGVIDILQLSGGEPTIHPEFFRILDWALANKSIGYILINTNAVRIAGDARFRESLAQRRKAHGKFELYMQFDGIQEAGQRDLRGVDLRDMRRKALDEIGALGVPSSLALVATPASMPHLGDTLRFALERPHCRGIIIQPMFNSGRTHHGVTSGTLPVLPQPTPTPISVGDIIAALAAQVPEYLREQDFTPLPCGDPNCHTISYLLRLPTGIHALGRLIDLNNLQGFLSDRADYRIEDLAKCGCESEPLAAILKQMEIGPDGPFRIFIKPFMDAWTFDQDRIDRCCTHVILPDGSLDSFCRHYLTRGLAHAQR